jgi:hypothetical protein
MGQGFSRMLQSISNDYLSAPNIQNHLKSSYAGAGFKDIDTTASGRANGKYRPSSSDRSKDKTSKNNRKYAN